MYSSEIVDQLVDREAIKNIHILYCHYIATKNLDGFLDLFTDDAHYTFTGEAPVLGDFVGRDQISKVFAKAAVHDFWPLAAGHAIFLTGPSSATGTAYSQVWDGKTNPKPASISIYNDDYVKVGPAKWKIAKRLYVAIKINAWG